MPQDWAPWLDDLRDRPELGELQKRYVKTMLHFSRQGQNFEAIHFDKIVTNENMRCILEYLILENIVPSTGKANPKNRRRVDPSLL